MNLNFGQAIEALKQGKKVARQGWNGKNMYLWLKTETIIKESWCKDPMLVEALKEFGFTTSISDKVEDGNCKAIKALGTICMKTATNEILTGWLASQSDILAEDWTILK